MFLWTRRLLLHLKRVALDACMCASGAPSPCRPLLLLPGSDEDQNRTLSSTHSHRKTVRPKQLKLGGPKSQSSTAYFTLSGGQSPHQTPLQAGWPCRPLHHPEQGWACMTQGWLGRSLRSPCCTARCRTGSWHLLTLPSTCMNCAVMNSWGQLGSKLRSRPRHWIGMLVMHVPRCLRDMCVVSGCGAI